MKKLIAYEIETTNARFELTIYEKPDNTFVGEYSGTTPKFAQMMRPGGELPMMKDVNGGKITNSSIEKVEVKCREEIEKLDGEILRSTELKV